MLSLLARLWDRLPVRFRERLLLVTQSTFTVGVSGVILDERGDALLLKNRFRYSHAWELPGGFVARGEDLEAALVRELREETSLVITVEQLLSARMARRQHVDICYLCRVTGGRFQSRSPEILDGRFFAADALPESLPPSQREMIERSRPAPSR